MSKFVILWWILEGNCNLGGCTTLCRPLASSRVWAQSTDIHCPAKQWTRSRVKGSVLSRHTYLSTTMEYDKRNFLGHIIVCKLQIARKSDLAIWLSAAKRCGHAKYLFRLQTFECWFFLAIYNGHGTGQTMAAFLQILQVEWKRAPKH